MTGSPRASDEPLRDLLQRQLGEAYALTRELSGGGSAYVFLATEVALDRQVVLKVLPPQLTDGVDGERFRREILIAARLQHPHLVPLLSAGDVHDDVTGRSLRWFTMPFIDGRSLRDQLHLRGPMPLSTALRMIRELATALAYAHARGVVHRDIKPENILLSDGVSMISDFGVAKALDDASGDSLKSGRRVTTVSMTLGTPAYMAPEQVNNARVVDHKADLYAFACVAYEMLTGSAPLVRSSLRATMAAQLSEQPVPLRQLRADVPPALSDMLMRCLEKDPLQRPHSATAVVRVLDELSSDQVTVQDEGHGAGTSRASTLSPPSSPATKRNSSTLVAAMLATAALLLVIVSWWVFTQR